MKVWLDGTVLRARRGTGLGLRPRAHRRRRRVRDRQGASAGVPFALTRHLDRLAVSARGLGLEPPDDDLLRGAVAETLAANADHHGSPLRLRITLTGGTSPLGSDRGDAGPTLVVALAPDGLLGADGEGRSSCRGPATSAPPPQGVKTTSYADNVVALAHAKARGATEALLLNTAGLLCEGTGSNVFVVLDGELVTPPLSVRLPGRGHPGAGAGVDRRRRARRAAERAARGRRGVPHLVHPGRPGRARRRGRRVRRHAGPGHRRGRGRLRRALGRGHRP